MADVDQQHRSASINKKATMPTNPSLRLKPFLNTQNATAESNGKSGPKRIRQIETP
jgi:hypothetical protein